MTSSDNSISLMINNHVILLESECSHCFTSDIVKIRLEEEES
jgi:hypothetical protein